MHSHSTVLWLGFVAEILNLLCFGFARQNSPKKFFLNFPTVLINNYILWCIANINIHGSYIMH